MDLVAANIQNLIRLWSLGGKRAGQLQEFKNYSVSRVANSDWPNKLWFKRMPDMELFQKVMALHILDGITIPVWPETPGLEDMLINADFQLKNELTGMSVPLERFSPARGNLQVIEVTDRKSAEKWSQLFYEAFGYLLDPRTVELTMDTMDYYLAVNGEAMVGTVVLYRDSLHVAGIHSMGIIPEHRRKGYAAELLLQVLSLARQKGAMYGVLQASEMGKDLYEKIGFKDEFILRNYVKPELKQQ